MYLIQGLFFQKNSMGNVTGPFENFFGPKPNLLRVPFFGFIAETGDQEPVLQGRIHDPFGVSELSAIQKKVGRFQFIKTYGPENENQEFFCEFKKHRKKFWAGQYTSTASGATCSGAINCILEELPKEMLIPQTLF